MQETPVWSLGWENLLEKGLATHSSILGFPCGSTGKESTSNGGDLGSVPGLGRSPGEGKGYSLQYSGLENSMDCIVHEVIKSWAGLSNFHFLLLHRITGSRTYGLQKLWFPGSRAQKLWHVGSVVVALRLQSTGSIVVAHGLGCSSAYGIFPDQRANPCLLHWRVDSLLLNHHGSSHLCFCFRFLTSCSHNDYFLEPSLNSGRGPSEC